MELFEEYVAMQASGHPEPSVGRQDWHKVSIYWAIAKAHSRPCGLEPEMPTQDGFVHPDIMNDFKSMVLRYVNTGQSQISTNDAHLKLVEIGVGNIVQQSRRVAVSICEPLVVRAACFFYGLQEEQELSSSPDEHE